MKEFIDWAFYGVVPEGCTPETAYKCYCIWCKLFDYEPIKKFKFIELWGRYCVNDYLFEKWTNN